MKVNASSTYRGRMARERHRHGVTVLSGHQQLNSVYLPMPVKHCLPSVTVASLGSVF